MKSEIWLELKKESERCKICCEENLVEKDAFPLFTNEPPQNTDILFVLEAPNYNDTYKKGGHLTFEEDTDESGKFFRKLFTEELKFNLSTDLFVTNSVLCLPKYKKGRHPVSTRQRKNCVLHLKRQIEKLNPMIVCTLGREALKAVSLIEDPILSRKKLSEVSGKDINWFDRKLFPLCHTGLQARNGPTGRDEKSQRMDWQKLRELWKRL